MDTIYTLALVYTFGFIGGGLKYIDQAYDVNIFNKKTAWMLVLMVGITMGVAMTFDHMAGELLLAIILGVAFTSKLDNWAFRTVALMAIATPGAFAYLSGQPMPIQLRWLPIGILTIAAVLDEVFDGLSHKKGWHLFQYRPFLKAIMMVSVLMSLMQPEYFLALLAFDLSYIGVTFYSKTLACNLDQLSRKSCDILIDA